MKNFLFIYLFITLSIVVNSCEEGYKSENSDGSTLFTLALKEVIAVPYLTTDNTPDYTFSSNVAGNITYGGLCSSSTTVASQGNNKITLDPLSNGTYSDCTITVDTEGPWLIGSLTLSSFIVEDPTSPTIAEVTVVTTPTNDSTPNYTFSSDQAGTITYGGSCSSNTTSATSGNNRITLNSLNDGTYSDCTIKVTNASGYVSDSITITSFVVDSTAATLAEVTAVTTPTNDSTPEYTFSSDKAGTITYGGSCSSSNTYPYPSATNGNNTITLTSLIDGTYSDCTITVTGDSASDVSNTLTMSPFTIKCLSKCFVAVGSGSTYSENALTRSQDNGTSWDIAKLPTSDTTLYTAGWSDKYFIASINGVTFGNNTFVAVGGYGFILRSTDNGSSFDLATSPYTINYSSHGLRGVAFGNSTFVGVGDNGTIVRSTNSDGSSWDNGTSPITTHIHGVTFGNNTFVAVGYYGNIV